MHSRHRIALIVACLLLLGSSSLTQADRHALPQDAMAVQVWKASPVADDCAGPVDGAGRAWYEPRFDDADWADVPLPDLDSVPPEQDRYYRLHYALSRVTPTDMVLAADDGVALYVNGHPVRTWGAADCHGEGAAEATLDITGYLRRGDNVIAIHLSNGPGASRLEATLVQRPIVSTPVVPFLDLPYDYRSSNFITEVSSTSQGGRITAYFDHQFPGSCSGGGCSPSDTRALHFFGYEGGVTSQDGARYDIYYNGHSGTDFALATGRAVLAAADGIVSFMGSIPSVCSDGRTRSALVVKVLHANGYTTEYWHLSAFAQDLEVGSPVSRDPARPIGLAGETGCATGPHLHLAVYNSSGVVVDPFAWSPRPDTPWFGQADPWQRSRSGRYLWVHPLVAGGDADPAAGATVYSPSGTARVSVPAAASPTAFRLDVAEGLPPMRIPNRFGLFVFSTAAYGADGVPLPELSMDAWVDVRLSGARLRAVAENQVPPVVLRWDPDLERWISLPTLWDPASRVASAPTNRLGTFALAIATYFYYLPVVTQHTPPATPVPELLIPDLPGR